MDLNRVRALLEEALVALQPPPVVAAPIATPDVLDLAIAAAAAAGATDAVLTLSPALVYPSALTLRAPITLQSAVPEGRMTRELPLPSFRGGISVTGDHVTLRGIEVRHPNPLVDVLLAYGAHVTFDRVRVLGDPIRGAKRGIAGNSNGDLTIRQCYVADCFATYPGNDSQAFCAWDMAPGLVIEDCYLEGGSETIMFGGADSSSDARNPRVVLIKGNTITKNPAWMALPIGVKNTLELKNLSEFRIEDNTIEYSWGGHGQAGFLLALAVRNQSGGCPTCIIRDGVITRNKFAHGAAAITVLGTDNNKPSGLLTRVVISDNTFSDLSPVFYTAPGTSGSSRKVIELGGGSQDLSITGNTFTASGSFSSALYFYGPVPANAHQNLIFTNNVLPKSTYGIFGEGTMIGKVGEIPPVWVRYVVNGKYEGNTIPP